MTSSDLLIHIAIILLLSSLLGFSYTYFQKKDSKRRYTSPSEYDLRKRESDVRKQEAKVDQKIQELNYQEAQIQRSEEKANAIILHKDQILRKIHEQMSTEYNRKTELLNKREIQQKALEWKNHQDQLTINQAKDLLLQQEHELHKLQQSINQQQLLLKQRASDLTTKEKQIEDSQLNIQIANARLKDIPILAQIYADIRAAQTENIIHILGDKKRPALKAADIVKEIKQLNRFLDLRMKSAEYKCLLYETMVPYLEDLDQEDSLADLGDIVKNQNYYGNNSDDLYWLSNEEYKQLPSTEKFQLALDRWWKRKKTRSEIGSSYERYIGYELESQGWRVEYNGIKKGLCDMGIDLIATKGDIYMTVQCKCWSKDKTIHEKHINQLFGSTVDHYLTQINNSGSFSDLYNCISSHKLRMLFITSTSLSETAKKVANTLNVEYIENKKLQPYPIIKCNINSRGERIYHLPYDQQYDRTTISKSGECYVTTVKEAESLGFRRAQKHDFS